MFSLWGKKDQEYTKIERIEETDKKDKKNSRFDDLNELIEKMLFSTKEEEIKGAESLLFDYSEAILIDYANYLDRQEYIHRLIFLQKKLSLKQDMAKKYIKSIKPMFATILYKDDGKLFDGRPAEEVYGKSAVQRAQQRFTK